MAVNEYMAKSLKGFEARTDYTGWEANSSILFCLDGGSSTFLRNVSAYVLYYATTHLRRHYLYSHLRENLKSHEWY
jgi:hypothetical protein